MEYVYKYIEFEGGCCISDERTIAGLNDLGKKGWLLVERPRECHTNPVFTYIAMFYKKIKIE